MARSLISEITDELSARGYFPFFCLDYTDGTTAYKYTTLDVPARLNYIDFDNAANIIVDTYALDAKEFSDWSNDNSSDTQDSVIAPDGTDTGVKLTEDGTAAAVSQHQLCNESTD